MQVRAGGGVQERREGSVGVAKKSKEEETGEAPVASGNSFTLENILGIGGHYKTTISDGEDKVEGLGRTSEGSQQVASEKWDKK